MLAMWTLSVIVGNRAVINLLVLYLYILKGKLHFCLYFNITSLIFSDRGVFLHCAPSVGKQREVGVSVMVPLSCKMEVPCSCGCCPDNQQACPKPGNSQFCRIATSVAACPTSFTGAPPNKEHTADAPKLESSSSILSVQGSPLLVVYQR